MEYYATFFSCNVSSEVLCSLTGFSAGGLRFGPLMMVLFYGFHASEEQTCQSSVMRFMRTSALDGMVCIESAMIRITAVLTYDFGLS